MSLCYTLFANYGVAIISFTIITKLILFPISIWVQKNSIKMVKMQPEINRLKARFFGDGERIAEEQAIIFKREKYNPFASLIPLFLQIMLLVGVIEVLYHPLSHLLHIPTDAINALVMLTGELTGIDITLPSIQIAVVSAVQNPEFLQAFLSLQGTAFNTITAIQSLNTNFLLFDLSLSPIFVLHLAILVPIIAGLSSWLMCHVQNKINVLQAEQSKFVQYLTLILSVGLSLYLGLFVPSGVALYWIAGNLLAIAQLYILNAIIQPKRYIDYEALISSRKELEILNNLGDKKKKWYQKDENTKREKTDYKRFFSIANKHIVFYSEKSGFYKYFEGVIEELLRISNITIHYITSDPVDKIFDLAQKESRIKPYYIGEKKLIILMMKMDANMVIMTMTDLENYHIKRSIVKKDVHYLYIFHYPLSTHMVSLKGAFDNYDTLFCVGSHQINEIKKWEQIENLSTKNLILTGYDVLEKMDIEYKQQVENQGELLNNPKIILIAPSWQEDNIFDRCIDEILRNLLTSEYKIIVRPHPEYVKRSSVKMDKIVNDYSNYSQEKLEFELDFTKSSTIFDADMLITDWSGVAYEFSFITKKPSLFINTKMKVNNPDYEKIGIVPLEISLRDKIGKSLEIIEISTIANTIDMLMNQQESYHNEISEIFSDTIANFGDSSKIGAKAILNILSNNGGKSKNQ